MTGRLGPDAELVARVRQGDAQAFDALVRRHRARLYDLARHLTGGHEAAEDVVQEALLRAYRALPSLRDGGRVGPWLTAIVRREGLRWLREGGRNGATSLDSVSEIVAGTGAVAPGPPEEIAALVSQALQPLSARHRRVLIEHYLEGRSLQEIAAELGVSEGRVKRLLFDSRQAARKGYTAMADTERKGPRELSYWTSGNVPDGKWDIGQALRSSLAQAVCLTVNKQPKTVKQIAEAVESHPAYVEGVVEQLSELEALESPRRGTYLLNFLALDAEDWRRVVARMREPAGEMARRLTEAQPGLERAFGRTSLAAAGWTWQDVVWVFNAVFVANHGVATPAGDDQLLSPPERPGGFQYWVGGHESGPDVPFMDAPGFYGTARRDWEIGHFGPGMEHANQGWIFAPPGHGVTVLQALLAGPRTEEEVLAAVASIDRERGRATLAKLVQAGLVAREGEGFRLTFPVFGPGDKEVLSEPIRAVARPLVAEVLHPAWADQGSLFDQLGYQARRDHYQVWRFWLAGFIAGEALRFMVKQGTLPELGETPPAPWSYAAAWGTNLWL